MRRRYRDVTRLAPRSRLGQARVKEQYDQCCRWYVSASASFKPSTLGVEPEQVVVPVAHDALLIDYHDCAVDPEPFRGGTVGLCDLLVDVGEQRYVQALLGDQLLVRG